MALVKMKTYLSRFSCLLLVAWQLCGSLQAEDWAQTEDPETGKTILTINLDLYSASEATPALKYRLIPDEFERRDGNSAIYYLRAMGFLEQNAAKQKLMDVWDAAREEAADKGLSVRDFPPYTWLEMPPDKLPLEEVKQYLSLTSFQPRDMKVARNLKAFDLDRNVKELESPIMTLIPEIQTLRELARNQSLRCRVAIAEKRFDDAFDILGQQFALANHLSEEPFLVSNLVGAAIANIASTDALYATQLPDAPNLYWAYATLPSPLIDVSNSMAYERQLLFLEVKPLSEVDETPRPVGYWNDFIDRVFTKYSPIMNDFHFDSDNPTQMDRFAFVSVVGAAYPGAKRYLTETLGMEKELVEQYPTAQVVFLAQKKFYEQTRDEVFKWFYIDANTPNSIEAKEAVQERLGREAEKVGWSTLPVTELLPAVQAVGDAVKRVQLMVAMLQTIEAIRDYAADHEGLLPENLEAMTLPAPKDPFTGKALQYEINGGSATLTANANRIIYRVNIRLAK